MIIDIRGRSDEETYLNGVLAMAVLGYKPIRVVCESCGEDAYVFSEELFDAEGFSRNTCKCGGKMKREE